MTQTPNSQTRKSSFRFRSALLATASLLVLAGCRGPDTDPEAASARSSTAPTASETTAAAALADEASGPPQLEPTDETAHTAQAPIADDARLVTVGGGITEIVFALGRGASVVGVDSSSALIAGAEQLPSVGTMHRVTAEGILSVGATVVIGSGNDGTGAVAAQLAQAGVRHVPLDEVTNIEDALRRIEALGVLLGRTDEASRLVTAANAEIEHVARAIESSTRPTVLFLYARGHGTLLVSGIGTLAHALIEAAGGRNAVSAFDNFQPLTPEALVTAQPDVFLVTSKGLESLGGIEGLVAVPGVADTPGGRAGRVVAIDDHLLLGAGPRIGEAVATLAAALHPSIALPATGTTP
jgi:iron complex transport system substrate-binding protein